MIPWKQIAIPLGVATFMGSLLSGNKTRLKIELARAFFSEIKNEQHKIKKRTTFYLHSICIDCAS